MDQYIGKMLDNRYEILERIGTGGMAVVYKARCHRLNRLVAIKILKSELASDEDFLRRFQAESQAVAMLSHINIVSIYDVCRTDGLDYIVMELIDGMTLKQYMQKRGVPLNWREALHFITQIVRALGHAHSRGIVHRDIKPHNIMVLRDGSVKVTDFGIARLTSAAQATLTQEALGSVHYISPEQAKGSHVDGRSDLYSVGVMLYEMLTGRLPFEGETPVFVAIQHINSIPISPRELNPDIPEALEAITLKAMAPNPDQRYLSADDMLEDIKNFRKNPGVAVAQPVKDEEEEVEEPTMVMPVSSIQAAKADAEKNENKTADESSKADGEKVQKSAEAQPQESPVVKRSKQRDEEDDEDNYDYRRPKRSRFPAGLIAFFAILIFIGGIGYFLYNFLLKDLFMPAEEYTIPDLRGYTVEEITNNPSILAGFTFEVSLTIADEDYEVGEICRQQPSANDKVKDPDTVIYVTVSSGEEQMYIPNVINMEARQALQLLQNDMKLRVSQNEAYHDEIAKGHVVACSLMEGTRVYKGDAVTITISKGPEPITINVTPFIDVNIDQAQSQALALGLTIGGVEYFYSDLYAVDRVIWQSIPADTMVEPGTAIYFQVSLGPEPEVIDPSASPEPSPSEEIPIPTTGVEAPATIQTVEVDLSAYEGIVTLRIVVGDLTIHDSGVDCAVTPMISRTVEGTGVQLVSIYINDVLVNSYELNFNP